MPETLTFHFEGGLAATHRMNFYEAARFQYAASRLLVKLAQFRINGRFTKKISRKGNFNIQVVAGNVGSFNYVAEDETKRGDTGPLIDMSLADLIAFVSERVVEKLDAGTVAAEIAQNASEEDLARIERQDRTSEQVKASDPEEQIFDDLTAVTATSLNDQDLIEVFSYATQVLIRRRAAELARERRLAIARAGASQISEAQTQSLVAMAAPLIKEMATALRTSAETLVIVPTSDIEPRPLLYLDRGMAQEIETAVVDPTITPILCDVTQFNKNNGWGKLTLEGLKTVSFNVPYDVLPQIKQELIDGMKTDLVYVQAYFVRDRGKEVKRLIVVGILPTPT